MSIAQFKVIEVVEKAIGFLQVAEGKGCMEVVELHLLPGYRGQGIGSSILCRLLMNCWQRGFTLRLGCFKENYRARDLYRRLGFRQIAETDTHCILEATPAQTIPN